MKTYSEAIEHLRMRGLHAAERNWSLGETIVVGIDRIDGPAGLVGFRRAAFIIRNETGWTSMEPDHTRTDDDLILTLAQLCARVERFLLEPSAMTSARKAPSP